MRRPLPKLVCGPPSSCRFCAWNSASKGVELVAEHSFANNYRDFNRSNKKTLKEGSNTTFSSNLAGFSELLGEEVDILERLDGENHGPDVREPRRTEQVLR